MGQNALTLLTNRLFDYAGMFPPTSLDLQTVLALHESFEGKLLRPSLASGLIVLDLPNFKSLLALSPKHPLPVALLGSPAHSLLDLASDSRKQELALVTNYSKNKSSGGPSVHSYEVRLTAALSEDPEVLGEALRLITSDLQKADISFSFEPDLSSNTWRETLKSTTAALHLLGKEYGLQRAKLKFRGAGSAGSGTTGIGAKKISKVITESVAQGLLIKATAGLHHPLIETARYGNQLGFINLCVAHTLHRSAPFTFTEEKVLECLNSQERSDFSFSQGIYYRDFGISLFEAEEILGNFPLVIGSCSLQEPDQDLARLFPN